MNVEIIFCVLPLFPQTLREFVVGVLRQLNGQLYWSS